MRRKIKYTLVALASAGAVTTLGATEVRQTDITENTTWRRTNSPYYIYGDINIKNGATLTIEAGVEVRFVEIHGDGGYEDGAELVVRDGALVTQGTPALPVRFTSANEIKKAGDWGAIIVEYNSQYVLKNAEIEYAKNGLRLYRTTATSASRSSVEGTVIRFCSGNGVFAYDATADFYHLTLVSNNSCGVRTSGLVNLSVRASDIYSNGVYNFYNGSPSNVDAADCWWGTTIPGIIELYIYDRADNPAMGVVDYTPFLSGPWRERGNVPTYSLGFVKSVFR